ncbi:MAG: AEC family transporter [Chloroflexi bacterium]|nr:AEC family transporter [Chloroflexota bacterium]
MLAEILEIIFNTISPIFLVIGVAALVDRRFQPDPQGLSRLVIYVFTPALVLDGLANSDVGGDEAVQLITVSVVMMIAVAGIAYGVTRLLGFERMQASAFILAATMINAGNYGYPLNEFAFGPAGAERAIIFFVGTVVMSNTLGVYLASLGSASARQALVNVFIVPLPYAAVLGLGINVTGTEMPVPIARAVAVLSDAAIPGMLMVLGIQLSRTKLDRGRLRPVLAAAGMRLLVGPLVAVVLVLVLGMSGTTRQVAIVQSAMPTAVLSGVLATEFGSDAEFVTSTILASTLLSIATLSVLLAILM